MRTKKTFLPVMVMLSVLLFSAIFSCIQDDNIDDRGERNLPKLESLKGREVSDVNSDEISPLLLKLGASKKRFKTVGEFKVVNFNSRKTFEFNGKEQDISNYTFIIGDNLITLNEDKNFKIGLLKGNAYIITPNYTGLYSEANISIKKDVKSFALVMFLNDLLYKKQKINLDNYSIAGKSKEKCAIWDQKFSIGIGINSTSAKADLEDSIEKDEKRNKDGKCRKIGKPEAVSFTDGTVWAQTWCCS